MGADSLASSEDLRVASTTPKIYRAKNLLFGFSGSYGAGALLIALLKDNPNMTIKQLAEYPPSGSDWEMLLADAKGIYEFQPGGGLVKMTTRKGCAYGVVGSGSSVALGSLYSWHDGRESLCSALRAAETHTNRVRGPFKIVTL
jgi:20S proteasome alpha/beta subunit